MSHPIKTYTKPPKTAAQLVAHLESKGLTVTSISLAQKAIERRGYYRLLLYTRSFQDVNKRFKAGTTFDDLLSAYEFDRELRLLCMGPIERIEIALRAAFVNELSIAHGAHFYMDRHHFEQDDGYRDFLRNIASLNQKDPPVKHYYDNYNAPALPPIWVCLESLSFGVLSRLFSKLHVRERKLVSKAFNFNESVLVSWFRAINGLRNDCAHHNTLWDTFTPNAPCSARGLAPLFTRNRNQFSDRAVVLVSLLNVVEPNHTWKAELKGLFAKYPQIEPRKLGFKTGWDSDSYWL